MGGDDTRALPHQSQNLEQEELSPGTLAGEYEILGTVAAGGCGTVYAAEHRVLRRRAAVKVLHREMAASIEAVQRFVREARAVNLVRHPNIVDVYEYGQLADGRPYYVMEFLDGLNLDAYLKKHGTLSPADVFELIEPICDALAAVHAAGVIHRDLKASNVFVARSGLPWRVKLLDFGVAKLLHPEPGEPGLTSTEHRLGTPLSMAPEQIQNGPVDARTDIYAMGVLVYYLLTGEYPFRGTPTDLEWLHLKAPAPSPSRIVPLSPELEAVVLRCLAKDPRDRFASITDYLAALRDATSPAATTSFAVVPAVSLYAELWLETENVMDDALLEDMGRVLDLIDERLRADGFAIPVQTGSSILGISVVNGEPVHAACRRAIETAKALALALLARATRDRRIHVNLCAHTDRVVVRPSGTTSTFGGPLVQIGTWAPREKLYAPCITTEVADEVSEYAQSARQGQYVLLP